MIQAAPFLIAPFAEALGLSVAALGMAKVTDTVNKYIQENPEQSKKIMAMILPAQGIASMLDNKKRGMGDNNPPSPMEKEKPPQQEPPEGPNLGTEIADTLATEAVKKLADRKKEKSLNLKEIDDSDDMELNVPDNYTGPTISTLEELASDAFPFSKEDFKGGALDNKVIKKAFLKIHGDIELTGGKSLDDASFLVTPPRGQQEIVLRFLKEQLITNEADEKIINQITTLQNNLANKIKDSGYYGAGAEAEKRTTNLPGYTKDLIKKRKLNAHGGLIDKPLLGRSRDI